MNLGLKSLGLALVAALVLAAMAAPGASATAKKFRAEQVATLTGETTVPEELEYPGTGVSTCETRTSNVTVGTEQTQIGNTTQLTGCVTGGVHTVVDMNGCTLIYTLHTGTTSTGGAATHAHGPGHLSCPAGSEITLTLTVFGFSVCTVHIPPQTPTSPTIDFKNVGSGATRAIEATSTVSGVTSVATDTGGGCDEGVHHNGSIRGTVLVKGYKDGSSHTAANQVGIWVE